MLQCSPDSNPVLTISWHPTSSRHFPLSFLPTLPPEIPPNTTNCDDRDKCKNQQLNRHQETKKSLLSHLIFPMEISTIHCMNMSLYIESDSFHMFCAFFGDKVLLRKDSILHKTESKYDSDPWTLTSVGTIRCLRDKN